MYLRNFFFPDAYAGDYGRLRNMKKIKTSNGKDEQEEWQELIGS